MCPSARTTPPATTPPATALDRPLAGVRVVTTAPNLPGPVAAHRLVGLGATVTKIEPPTGDMLAAVIPSFHRELAEGQEIRTLDLKTPDGRRELDTLLADADLLLTSSRPRALAGLGLSWEEVHARYPRLCQVSIVGHSGEGGDRPGHDLTYQAEAGVLVPPQMPTLPVADLLGGERVVGEATALLFRAARTGTGSYREVALAQAVEDAAASVRHRLTAPGAVLGGALPTYGLYQASDGWVALAAIEPHFMARTGAELGVDPMDRDALASVFRTRTVAEWTALAAAHDLPLVAVRVA
ncbi:CoA transferase [Corynebacterium terpenotabidum]|uniref:CoA transferase n=1 Tax=Corynebacterium terpenotabidum TaxID=89154 RepID=UPI000A04AB84